jgi:hypothetical protein
MKVQITVVADLKGASKAKLENDLYPSLTEEMGERLEGESYFVVSDEDDKEYEIEVSVTSVTMESK